MPIRDPDLMNGLDIAYRVPVATTALLRLYGGLIRSLDDVPLQVRPGIAPLFALVVSGLFPLGIVLQIIQRRIIRPWPVVWCIVATGLWCAMSVGVVALGN